MRPALVTLPGTYGSPDGFYVKAFRLVKAKEAAASMPWVAPGPVRFGIDILEQLH